MASLTAVLRALGLRTGMTVLVNASLSSIGEVEGGAATVVAAIREVLGPEGTLVSPATTEENSDTSRAYLARVKGMTREQARAFRAAMAPFDAATTPANCGRIAEEIRTTPGAFRSAHPQSSFTAIGAHARELMAKHPLDCHLGEESPLGRLYADGASVLLLGVGYRSCTAFHLAEYRYRDDPPRRQYRCVIRGRGWREFTDVVLDDSDFEKIGEVVDKETINVGTAPSRLLPIRDVVDLAEEWMRVNRSLWMSSNRASAEGLAVPYSDLNSGMPPGGRMSGPNGDSSDSPAPYFFLSYAHTPRHNPATTTDPDAWVGDLYADLCNHIMQFTTLPGGAKPGFMDRELRPGNDWTVGLSQALANCRVFVPLYSRRYFESEQCGKEWFAFSRRVLNQAAKDSRRLEAIIPAIWVPVEVDSLPEAARLIQFNHRELGDKYATRGFYGIIKLARYRDAYEEAVYELARRIVDVAQQSPVQPGPLDNYESLESAFGAAHLHTPGGRRVRLTVVAPTSDDLPDGRDSARYGRTAREWNPYRPETIRPLADHACDLVRNLDYRPIVSDLDSRAEELDAAGPASDPEILILDPWATIQPELDTILRRLDQQEKPWIQVVVLWNEHDAETVAAGSQLRGNLDKSLPKKLAEVRVTSRMAAHGVPCLEDFSRVLPLVVQTVARQYLKHAQAFPPTSPTVEKPQLSGPVADPRNPERTDD
jgi:FxsC-like protein